MQHEILFFLGTSKVVPELELKYLHELQVLNEPFYREEYPVNLFFWKVPIQWDGTRVNNDVIYKRMKLQGLLRLKFIRLLFSDCSFLVLIMKIFINIKIVIKRLKMSSQKRSKTGYPKRKANSIDEIQIKEIIMSSHGKPHLVDSSSHRYAH